MGEPTEIVSWDEAAVRAAPGEVRIPARRLPIPPPADLAPRIVPTTAGSETPEDACDTARLAAAILGHRRVSIVIEVDGLRDLEAESEAEDTLRAEGWEFDAADQKPNRSVS
jgi:hypothetical protein